jgi:hypothetical protein
VMPILTFVHPENKSEVNQADLISVLYGGRGKRQWSPDIEEGLGMAGFRGYLDQSVARAVGISGTSRS